MRQKAGRNERRNGEMVEAGKPSLETVVIHLEIKHTSANLRAEIVEEEWPSFS